MTLPGWIVRTARVPLVAAIVALLGVLLSIWWFQGERWWIAVAAVPFALGLGLGWLADDQVPDRPVRAVWLNEFWLLAPLTLAVLAAGAVVVVTVLLTVPDTASIETKKTIGALGTGVTTFLTSAFIAWTGSSDKSPVADRTQALFKRHFRGPTAEVPAGVRVHRFQLGSRGLNLVQMDAVYNISGWGWPGRLQRAREIAAELVSHASDPPVPAVPVQPPAAPAV